MGKQNRCACCGRMIDGKNVGFGGFTLELPADGNQKRCICSDCASLEWPERHSTKVANTKQEYSFVFGFIPEDKAEKVYQTLSSATYQYNICIEKNGKHKLYIQPAVNTSGLKKQLYSIRKIAGNIKTVMFQIDFSDSNRLELLEGFGSTIGMEGTEVWENSVSWVTHETDPTKISWTLEAIKEAVKRLHSVKSDALAKKAVKEVEESFRFLSHDRQKPKYNKVFYSEHPELLK